MPTLLKAIFITIICGLLALGGVWVIEPSKDAVVVWAIFFSVCMLGSEGLILRRLCKEKKAEDIRSGTGLLNLNHSNHQQQNKI